MVNPLLAVSAGALLSISVRLIGIVASASVSDHQCCVNTKGRFAFVDARRGIAALSVVAFHADDGRHIAELLGTIPSWLRFPVGDGDLRRTGNRRPNRHRLTIQSLHPRSVQ